MKRIFLLIVAFVPLILFAQNDIQLTQQFLSRTNYNPAATGASNYLNAYLIGRQQFVGFKGAPSTQVLNVHNYFEQINSGMGLTVVNDKIGAENSINAKIQYGYHIHFENNSYLSLGLGAGMLYKNIDANKFVPEEAGDETMWSYKDKRSKVSPDFDFGIEYNMEKWQIGASVTHLNVDPIKINNYESGRHMYMYTRYTFDLDGRDWKLGTGLAAHMSAWPLMQFELNAIAYYKSRFWFGGLLRANEQAKLGSFAGIVGLFITDFLRLGYSYDFNLSSINKYTNGSHEIMLSLRLGKGEGDSGRKTPRFFE